MFVLLLLVVAVILGAYTLGSSPKSFPVLPPGLYAGNLKRQEPSGTRVLQWVIDRRPTAEGQPSVGAVLSEDGSVSKVDFSETGESGLHPLKITLDSQAMLLTGVLRDGARSEGKVFTEDMQEAGSWDLSAVPETPAGEHNEARHLLLLLAEIEVVDDSIRTAETLVPAQKGEIEQLQHLVTNGEQLQQRAQEKMAAATQELEVVRRSVEEKQKEAIQLEAQLRLAQKINGRGKLVDLARESIEREARWARSLTIVPGGVLGDEIEAAAGKSSEVLGLRDAIGLEQQRINDLVKQLESREARE